MLCDHGWCPCYDRSSSGLVGLMRKDTDFGKFVSFHCIIHQESLYGKKLQLDLVMNVVMKIVNFIRARALNHRQFQLLLEEMEAEYGDLILHCDVRWLSKGKVLDRFFSLLPHIKEFLKEKKQNFPELSSATWLLDMAFLSDITGHLNTLNLKLQGSHFITELYSSVMAFIKKLSLFQSSLARYDLKHFPNLKKMASDLPTFTTADEAKEASEQSALRLSNLLGALLKDFQERFADFSKSEPLLHFVLNPFNADPEMISSTAVHCGLADVDFELEIIELQENIELKQRHLMSETFCDFWKLVNTQTYPVSCMLTSKIASFFGSTYLCEQTFSVMNILKSKLRNRITTENLLGQLRTAVSNYEPRYAALI